MFSPCWFSLRLLCLRTFCQCTGEISADVVWGKKYEKRKRKRGNIKENARKGKKKNDRGKKKIKWK
jgi:hypothetical protein